MGRMVTQRDETESDEAEGHLHRFPRTTAMTYSRITMTWLRATVANGWSKRR
jgi:hypothetical protein